MASFIGTFDFFLVVFGVVNVSIGLAENPDETGNYMEGDIVSVAPSLQAAITRSGILGGKFRWTDATIPYEFEPRYPFFLRAQFRRAIQHISQRTCVKFTPRTNEQDYIYVISGKGCYSHVGRIGGKQEVSLPFNCYRLGVFAHELMHAIGFHHEQSRTDRDDFITIKYENIRPGLEHNFDKFEANKISSFGVPYDYGSVMHYSKSAFSRGNGRDTIVPRKAGVEIGQRSGMSELDAAKINNMYCKNFGRQGRELKLF